MRYAQDADHREPQQHHRSEELADGTRAVLLDEEEHRQNGNGDGDDGCRRLVGAQSLDGRQYRYRRRDDPVGDECARADDGQEVEPRPAVLPHEGVEC